MIRSLRIIIVSSMAAMCLVTSGCSISDCIGTLRLIEIKMDLNQGVDYGLPPEYYERQVRELEAKYKELGMQEFYDRHFRAHLLANSKKLNYALPEKSEP